jgi:hypothetical protein
LYWLRTCAFGDEAPDIAQLFSAAGYNVIFKCNDPRLCPAGPPFLDDYEGWSKHAFVVVSSVGDDNAAGDTPIIMSGASLDFQNTEYIVSDMFCMNCLQFCVFQQAVLRVAMQLLGVVLCQFA